MVEQALGLRSFVPTRDTGSSQRFYEALGFTVFHLAGEVVILQLDGFGFILRNFYLAALAENLMLQLLVRDVDAGPVWTVPP